MFHKVKDVTPLENLVLSVQFCEGETRLYDTSGLPSKIPAFKRLLNEKGTFESVHVDVGGYGIVWDDELDLSCDELWDNGTPSHTPFDGLLALSDATTLWRLNESTLRKAIAYGKLKNGTDVQKFGKQWVVSAAAMHREYGTPK